jgi:hypothetical protein
MSQKQRRPIVTSDEAPNTNELGHILSQLPRGRKLATVLRIIADLVEEDPKPTPAPAAPKYITTKEAVATYGMGESALVARHIRRVKRGRTWGWLVEDIEKHLAENAQPAKPRIRKVEAPAVNMDPLDQMLARGELRRVGGGR